MRRVKGTYDGSCVVLKEHVSIPPDTEVDVLVPEPDEPSLVAVIEKLDRTPPGDVLSLQEVAALVHEVRAARQ